MSVLFPYSGGTFLTFTLRLEDPLGQTLMSVGFGGTWDGCTVFSAIGGRTDILKLVGSEPLLKDVRSSPNPRQHGAKTPPQNATRVF